MTLKKGIRSVILALTLVLLFSHNVWALIAWNDFYNFNFRFNSPGARANAMGGAFIGLADDATAAYTNPAGLTILTQPEISLEYKIGTYDNTRRDAVSPPLAFEEKASGFSFLSFAYPMERATVTVYRHQLIDLSSEYSEPFVYTQNDIKTATYGIGLGIKILDSLSVGFSVGFAQLDWYFRQELFTNPTQPWSPTLRIQIKDSDTAEQYTLSLLWNPIGDLNVGLVYRQGPEFETIFETHVDSDLDTYFDQYRKIENTLKVPDVYGIGISYRFLFGLTAAVDVNYIEYSDILKNYRWFDGRVDQLSEFEVDDTVEVHAGLEYVLDVGAIPFAVRGGYHYKPDHRITYKGDSSTFRTIAPEGDDDHIYSVGIGAVFFKNVQVDVAGSFGDLETEYTFSFVLRLD